MKDLGFKIERTPYPAASRMTGFVVQKVRKDGRVGSVVGDEANLWDALQEALEELRVVRLELSATIEDKLDAEKRCAELTTQMEQRREKTKR